MASILFLIFGALDLVAGAIITIGTVSLLPEIAKYIGIFLIGKGIWTIATSVAS